MKEVTLCSNDMELVEFKWGIDMIITARLLKKLAEKEER